MPGTNTLDYSTFTLLAKTKSFVTLTPGGCVIKLSTFIILKSVIHFVKLL